MRRHGRLEARHRTARFSRSARVGIVCLVLYLGGSAAWSAAKDHDPVGAAPAFIDNPAVPRQPLTTLTLEELWRIGGDTDTDEEIFGSILQLLCDDDGNLYVLDGQLGSLRVFAPDGSYVRAIGRRGEGPGEFSRPLSVFVLAGGEVGVLCRQGIRLFQRDGTPAGSYALPSHAGRSSLVRARALEDDVVLCRVAMDFREDGYDATTSLVRCNRQGQEVACFTKETQARSLAHFVIDERHTNDWQTLWAVSPDGRVFAPPAFDRYEVQVWSPDGTLERVIRRAYEPMPRSPDALARAQERWEKIVRSRRGAKAAVSPTYRDILGLFPRADGSLWVLTGRGAHAPGFATGDAPHDPGALATFDVFDPGGHFTRQVTLVAPGSSPNNRFYFWRDRVFVVMGDAEEGNEAEVAPNTIVCYLLGAPSTR